MRVGRAQLLGELLLDRANVKVMMRYVGDPANLKLMMILLKDTSRSIQFEAFHVFKARALESSRGAWSGAPPAQYCHPQCRGSRGAAGLAFG